MISCEKDEFLVKCKCWSCCSHAVNVCSHGWCILRILSVYFVLKSMFFSDAGIGLHFSSTRTWLSILLSFSRLSLAIASALLFSVSKAFIQIQCKICITQWRGLGQFDVVICCFGTMTITKKTNGIIQSDYLCLILYSEPTLCAPSERHSAVLTDFPFLGAHACRASGFKNTAINLHIWRDRLQVLWTMTLKRQNAWQT